MERIRSGRPARGFTLIELLVAAAVAAVVLGLAVPRFSRFVTEVRVSGAAAEIRGALHTARAMAVARGSVVTLCKSADGSTCATSGDWDQGWMLFADPANIGVLDASAEAPIRIWSKPLEGVRVWGNRYVSNYVSYRPWGEARLASDALQMGRIWVCPRRSGVEGRELVVSRTGRVNVERFVCE